MPSLDDVRYILGQCTDEQRIQVLRELRAKYAVHPLETKLNTTAEVILDAIDRSSDLTQRGVRGVIAESAFKINVLSRLAKWKDTTPAGDIPFDYRLEDGKGAVTVQVKMQRQKAHRPMIANEAYTRFPANMHVVETQRTRGGKDASTGEDTRPYSFGEFDILAVSLHPSTNNWSNFRYTVSRWLLPKEDDASRILKFQPVPISAGDGWTDDFEEVVTWHRSGEVRKIPS